ncbi:hypothetical protein QTP88_024026 [Uroleucon formosanum]
MSRGLALEFNRRFGHTDVLKGQQKRIIEIAQLEHEGQKLLYLITKEKCFQKPMYENLYKTLQTLRSKTEQELISHIAMPRIGCGLDQLDWDTVKAMIKYVFKGSRIKIVIHSHQRYSLEEKLKILEEFHNGVLGGHQGISRTIKRIKMQHSWKGLKAGVIDFIKKCQSFQVNKASNHTVKQPMVITTTARTPFEKIFMDIVGPITTSYKNNSYILTIQDDLTKYSLAIPIPMHGANTKSLSKNSYVSTEHQNPSHRTLAEYLRHYVDKNLQDWDEYIPFAMFVYNTTPNSTTERQPYELLYGKPAEVPNSHSRTEEVRYNYDDCSYELKQRLQRAHDTARDTILKEKEKSKALYDRNAKSITVHVGDKVLTKWHAKKDKLSANWQGPFEFDNPSMYYHAMGNLCITDTYWNLLTYVNLKNYDKQIRMIDEGIKHVTQECKKFFEIATACLFNATGRVANVLFGICDDSDAEKFYNQINEFNQFKLSTSHLMQSQTTIIRNMVNDINETMQRVAKQAEVVDELITHERVTEMQSNRILKISLLSIKVDNLVDIVNYATLGHIHSSIMSPKTITQQMSDIKSKLPPNSEFPLETSTNSISDFFKNSYDYSNKCGRLIDFLY